MGGGTPSLLSAKQLDSILGSIHQHFNVLTNSEITLEANPGTIDLKYAQDYMNAGVNRISFGIQSFDNSELKFLNRIHTAEEAVASFNIIRSIGFDNISIDLIFGIPNQNEKIWENNLNNALLLNPEHISVYNLIYESDTKLYSDLNKNLFNIMPENLEEKLYLRTSDFFTQAGYEHYEVSNFAKPNFQARHNSKYWKHIPYYGFGPSSHSFSDGNRYRNYSNFAKYYNLIENGKLPIEEVEKLSDEEKFTEYLMLGLRSDGIDNNFIREKYNLDIEYLLNTELKYLSMYFKKDSKKIKLTPSGYFVINEIIISLIKKQT